MAKGQVPVEKLQQIETPFYYYDTELLRETLRCINTEAQKHLSFYLPFNFSLTSLPFLTYKILYCSNSEGHASCPPHG